MANWEDIINNRLTMGRVRWITYANNASRREEEEERRPGTGPSPGREGRPEPPRFLCWEPLREENFQRNPIRAWNRPEFVPQPFIQVHNPCPIQFLTNMYGPFGYVHPNAPPIPWINHLRPHLPHPRLSASPLPFP